MRVSVVLLACCGALLSLAACQATPVLSFPEDDASRPLDAALPDGAPGSLDPEEAGQDASGGGPDDGGAAGDPDAAGHDDSATDGGTIPDAVASPCGLGAGAPPGAACCGAIKCIGVACNHCSDCSATCGEWCCATENGGGKYKDTQCVDTPTDSNACPLTERD
jgi:hypothetical protein